MLAHFKFMCGKTRVSALGRVFSLTVSKVPLVMSNVLCGKDVMLKCRTILNKYIKTAQEDG